MAMRARPEWIALGLAGAVGLGMPVALLLPGRTAEAPPRETMPAPVAAGTWVPLARAYERPLFGAAEPEAAPADAPELVGIVGRLGADAVALVRTADGRTRTLGIGESVDGWSLASLAIDAAFFTRGTDRVRVPLPIDPDAAQ